VIKLLASGLVVFACGLIGMTIATGFARRPGQLRMMQSALRLLETEIAYGATPLPEALEKIGRACDPPVSTFFTEVRRTLSRATGCTAAEAWEAGLQELRAESAFKPDELAVLRSFGLGLGSSDRHEQQKNIRLAMEQLKIEEEKAESERKQEQMWRYLGFLVGLVVILVVY
jgi:stage III sporulation protein AB